MAMLAQEQLTCHWANLQELGSEEQSVQDPKEAATPMSREGSILEAGKIQCGGLKLHSVNKLIMVLLVRCGGQRHLREGACDVRGGALLVLNTQTALLESKDHALETAWSRG